MSEYETPHATLIPKGDGGGDLLMGGKVFPYHISIDEPVHYEKLMKDGFGKLTLTLFVEGFEDRRSPQALVVTYEDSSG